MGHQTLVREYSENETKSPSGRVNYRLALMILAIAALLATSVHGIKMGSDPIAEKLREREESDVLREVRILLRHRAEFSPSPSGARGQFLRR